MESISTVIVNSSNNKQFPSVYLLNIFPVTTCNDYSSYNSHIYTLILLFNKLLISCPQCNITQTYAYWNASIKKHLLSTDIAWGCNVTI